MGFVVLDLNVQKRERERESAHFRIKEGFCLRILYIEIEI